VERGGEGERVAYRKKNLQKKKKKLGFKERKGIYANCGDRVGGHRMKEEGSLLEVQGCRERKRDMAIILKRRGGRSEQR